MGLYVPREVMDLFDHLNLLHKEGLEFRNAVTFLQCVFVSAPNAYLVLVDKCVFAGLVQKVWQFTLIRIEFSF